MAMNGVRTPPPSGRSTGACGHRIIPGVPIFQPAFETMPRPELERLQRDRLCERFGVSRTPLRDALKILEGRLNA